MKLIRRLFLPFVLAACCGGLFLVGCDRGNRTSLKVPDVPDYVYASELLNLHNVERLSAPLSLDDQLNEVADRHAEWMADRTRLSHTGEGGSSVADRVGDGFSYVGENIAMGYADSETVMRAWLRSTGHRRNILNRAYDEMGVGIGYSEDGTMYWCVVFTDGDE